MLFPLKNLFLTSSCICRILNALPTPQDDTPFNETLVERALSARAVHLVGFDGCSSDQTSQIEHSWDEMSQIAAAAKDNIQFDKQVSEACNLLTHTL